MDVQVNNMNRGLRVASRSEEMSKLDSRLRNDAGLFAGSSSYS